MLGFIKLDNIQLRAYNQNRSHDITVNESGIHDIRVDTSGVYTKKRFRFSWDKIEDIYTKEHSVVIVTSDMTGYYIPFKHKDDAVFCKHWLLQQAFKMIGGNICEV